MRHLKRDMGMMLTGMALGVLLTGGAVAAGVMAEPSWQNIYVDGRQVQMTAYNIAGNNYVKLRDIGKEVGSNVYWQDGVQVDSTAPYTGVAPTQTLNAKTISVSSYKGNFLRAGDRSGLIISPGGPSYTAVSNHPAVVDVENVSGNWVAVAKAAGSAVITVTNSAGETGSLLLTVEGAVSADESSTPSGEIDLNANMEIRQEMIRLINQVRQENGKTELPTEESLMNAAQDVSSQCVGKHRPYDHQALIRYGWPHGGMYNLIVIDVNSFPDIAQKAVTAWTHSSGHFQTMVMDEGSCLGAGVTIKNGTAYCFMVIGDPTGHNPYE